MQIIDGKAVSQHIQDTLQDDINLIKSKGIIPTIVIVQVGDNQASCVYVRNKLRLCEKLQINGKLEKLPESVTEQELETLILRLNNDKDVNGILIQLPLPKHLNEERMIELINPIKDVDCFHLENVGSLWTAKKNFNGIKPCTPAGVIEMLKYYNIEMSGKNVVIIGRSNIVGKPQAALFLLENSTVTVCHSRTQNLPQICANADILVAAIGIAKFVTKDFTNPDQVIIDVGMDRDENGKLCGDVDFENVKDIVKAISPVPGGVGPMTIAMLLKNLITATKLQNEIK